MVTAHSRPETKFITLLLRMRTKNRQIHWGKYMPIKTLFPCYRKSRSTEQNGMVRFVTVTAK